ncbi:MAG: TIGR02206 family membrane protein [Nocardioides sp.]
MLPAAARFHAYGGQHLVVLAIFAAGAVALVLVGRAQRQRRTTRSVAFRRGFAVLVVAVTVPNQVWQLLPGHYDVGSSLPVNLCDLAWVAAAWALWTRDPVPVSLTYFWGLTLTIQGVLTPALREGFPAPAFFGFWAMHLLVVWAALYLTLGLGAGPTWRTYRLTLVVTTVWALAAYAFDRALGVNYGYLVHKPATASLFDPLGPWPVYLVVSLGLLAAGWAVLTWPWARSRSPYPENHA